LIEKTVSTNSISDRINYIIGAIDKIEEIDEKTVKVTIFDNSAVFICKKILGIKVGSGYKMGIKDTAIKDQYEIVSLEQQIIKNPAFKIKGAGTTMVQVPLEDYKNLMSNKDVLIRECCLRAAIDMIDKTEKGLDTHSFKRKTIDLARELEQYLD